MSREADALNVAGPISSASTNGLLGVFYQSTSTSAFRIQLPEGWRGRWVKVFAKGEEAQILLGGPSVQVNTDEPSGISSEIVTTDANTGWPIPAGASEEFWVPDNDDVTHMSIRAAGTGGVFIRPSNNLLGEGL